MGIDAQKPHTASPSGQVTRPGRAGRPIADHALLSDRHSAALVDNAGSVVWLCFPRFDSPSVFAALLDQDAGHWSINPEGPSRTARAYIASSMVLRTSFITADGEADLTDALAFGDSGDPHRLGQNTEHLLVRAVHCTRGRVRLRMEFQPRPEYGLVVPLLAPVPGGVLARGGPDTLILTAPVDLDIDGSGAGGLVELREGEKVYFGLHHRPLDRPGARTWSQDELAAALETTIAGWREWSRIHQSYQGPWRDMVHHSGRVLHALSYQPTGAIVAAATTSLPEQEGGDRNWDYRYTWVRDASLTMQALWVAACPDEADDFFTFMSTAAATYQPQRSLQIMFGVGGEHDLSERTLPHLSGWRGSRPVRAGNGAWNQPQLDVYGELLDAAFLLREQLHSPRVETCAFLTALADAAAAHWQEPDNGMWEVRGAPRHFLHSKLMCWVALDRAVRLADWLGATAKTADWQATADRIRDAILTRGWDERVGAFTQSFGSPALDASALMLPITGFLPATDPRVLATVDAITTNLTDPHGLVYRYRTGQSADAVDNVDGLAGSEGSFLLCTFWLAHALALAGRTGRAREIFELAAGHANDLGLLAEEVDPVSGEQLGNFPQAFSHIGLVNAAWAIHRAELEAADADGR